MPLRAEMTSKSPAELSDELRELLGETATPIQKQYRTLYDWMLQKGKNPRRQMGIAEATAKNYITRLDQLHRFSIQYLDPDDATRINDDDADTLLLMLDRGEITKQHGSDSGEEYGESAKRKFANSLEKYFKWRYHEGEMEYEWEPKIDFSDEKGEPAYRFTYRELGLLFDEAESYGSLPSYYDTSEEERNRINGLVAQRLGIPKEDVTRNDWLHADWSRKVNSMITVGYDAGLAPVEVRNAETQWYDPQTKTLKIPSEYACKEREKQEVGLADESAEALSAWFQERRHLEKYDGTNTIWLNREGNPYESGSLCRLLRKLCEEAGVKTEGRRVVWYSLRQTMGRNITDEGELSEANDQLRHSRLETTQERYNRTPVEKLQARLNETRRKAEQAATDPEYNPFEEPRKESNRNQAKVRATGRTADPDQVVTPIGDEGIHVDAEIADTTEARVDVTRRILNEDDKE